MGCDVCEPALPPSSSAGVQNSRAESFGGRGKLVTRTESGMVQVLLILSRVRTLLLEQVPTITGLGYSS